MPNLKDIRRRIASVKSTQKITRAMKLVAAAKLRRAQEAIVNARPYALKLQEMISELALRAEAGDHPLLSVREPKRVMLVVLTSDRGLCGAFNTNTLRATDRYRAQHADDHDRIDLAVVGKKGRDYFKYRKVEVRTYFPGVETKTAHDRSREISDGIIDEFLEEGDGKLDMVYLVYNEFKSAMQQKLTVEQLLPIVPMELPESDLSAVDFVYEPNKDEILDTVMPMYVRIEVLRALLETTASELGARMTAMENATNNARDMTSSLTLEYNKARQAAITKELLEIVAGAEALKG